MAVDEEYFEDDPTIYVNDAPSAPVYIESTSQPHVEGSFSLNEEPQWISRIRREHEVKALIRDAARVVLDRLHEQDGEEQAQNHEPTFNDPVDGLLKEGVVLEVGESSRRNGQGTQEDTLLPGPLHMKIFGLGIGESVVVHREQAAAEAIQPIDDVMWGRSEDKNRIGSVQTILGNDVPVLHSYNLHFIIGPDGQRLAPGFASISTIGNEGMVCVMADKTYLVTADDYGEAVKNQLALSTEEEERLVEYPIFLHATNLQVTRFDPREAKTQGHTTLLQLQGKDPFGLEKEATDPRDAVGRDVFGMVMNIPSFFREHYPDLITYAFEEHVTHEFLPMVDTDELIGRVIVSHFDDGTLIASLQRPVKPYASRQGGLILIRHANGSVMLTDPSLRVVTDGHIRGGDGKFRQAQDYIGRYKDNIWRMTESRATVVTQPTLMRRAWRSFCWLLNGDPAYQPPESPDYDQY